MQAVHVRFRPVLLLLVLGTSLVGCASPSPVLQDRPVLPPAPALSEPIPQESYSANVQRLLQTWREKLIGTLATP